MTTPTHHAINPKKFATPVHRLRNASPPWTRPACAHTWNVSSHQVDAPGRLPGEEHPEVDYDARDRERRRGEFSTVGARSHLCSLSTFTLRAARLACFFLAQASRPEMHRLNQRESGDYSDRPVGIRRSPLIRPSRVLMTVRPEKSTAHKARPSGL
jgi:hypothetical protein